jgi:hypothetical protein
MTKVSNEMTAGDEEQTREDVRIVPVEGTLRGTIRTVPSETFGHPLSTSVLLVRRPNYRQRPVGRKQIGAKDPSMDRKPPAKKPSPMGDGPDSAITLADVKTDLTPRFKLVCITATVLTFFFFAASVVLAVPRDESAIAKSVATGCLTMANIGFSAIVGLLGGKVL